MFYNAPWQPFMISMAVRISYTQTVVETAAVVAVSLTMFSRCVSSSSMRTAHHCCNTGDGKRKMISSVYSYAVAVFISAAALEIDVSC